jgi:hypothetical protein
VIVEELGKGEASENVENQQKLAVTWEHYTKTTVYNKKGQASEKVILAQTSAPPSEFLSPFEAELRKYAEHKFIAVSQAARRALLVENLTRSMRALLLEMDFSENYEIIHRIEMQSEHWGHQQVTIFMVISHWLEEQGDQEPTLRPEAHVFVSSDKNHDTFFVQHVLSHLAVSFKDKRFKQWYIDTDGAASHFKSRFTMKYMCELKEQLEKLAREGDAEAQTILVMWETCAPGHGKGPWDGLAAVIKSWIRRRETHGEGLGNGKTCQANDAFGIFQMLCQYARNWQKEVRARVKIDAWRLYFIPTAHDDIRTQPEGGTVMAPIIRPDPRPRVSALAGIRANFCFRAVDKDTIMVRRLSCHCESCRKEEWDACPNTEFGAWSKKKLFKTGGASQPLTRHALRTKLDNDRRKLAKDAQVGQIIALESAGDDWNSWWLAKVSKKCFKHTGRNKGPDEDGLRMTKNGWYIKAQIYARHPVTSSSTFKLTDQEARTVDAEGVIYTNAIPMQRKEDRHGREVLLLTNAARTAKHVEESLEKLSM